MYDELEKEFQSKGIPTDNPDFYDHPNFIKEERKESSYLVNLLNI